MPILSAIQNSSRRAAQWSAVLLALTIPVSVALDNLLLVMLLVSGLLAYLSPMWQIVLRHPVARAAALLFAALLIGCAYGATPIKEAGSMLGKYVDLAFVPLLLLIFKDDKLRARAEHFFLLAMIVTMSVSWLVGLNILGTSACMWDGCTVDNPSIFRSHITQNIMMAYASYLFALRARVMHAACYRWIYIGLAVLSGCDVLFLVQGRTGYLALGVLLAYFMLTTLQQRLRTLGRHLGWREISGVIALALLVIWGAYQLSPRLHQRMDLVVTEFKQWQHDGKSNTSTGLRLEFYRNSANIVAQHPWVGVGTGGFAEAYRQQVALSGFPATENPHNEYLHLAVQLGIFGSAIFFYLLYTQWRTVALLDDEQVRDAAAGLVLMLIVTSLFNTPLMDHSEGLFFAYMSALCFASLKQKANYA